MAYTRQQIKHLVRLLKEYHHYTYEPVYVVLEDSFISDDFEETLKTKLKETFPNIYYIMFVADLEALNKSLQDYHEGPFAQWRIMLIEEESEQPS